MTEQTIMAKEVAEKRSQDARSWYLERRNWITTAIPELSDTPFVKHIPLRCKLLKTHAMLAHSLVTVKEEYAGPWAVMCVHCGAVFREWATGGGFEGPQFNFEFFGYGDPNISRKLKT